MLIIRMKYLIGERAEILPIILISNPALFPATIVPKLYYIQDCMSKIIKEMIAVPSECNLG